MILDCITRLVTRAGFSIREALFLAALIIAAIIVRIELADYSLGFDDFASLFFAEQPLSVLWSDWMVRETNPPLYYSMLHVWVSLFGHSEMAIRWLSIIGAAVGIAMLAMLVRPRFGIRAAIAVVVLTGLSAHHVFFSLAARGYIFAFDGVVLSLFGLFAMIEQPQMDRRHALPAVACYAIGSLVAIYSHTTMVIWPVAATAGVFVLRWRTLLENRGRLLVILAIANLVVLVGAAWWLSITVIQMRGVNHNISWIEPVGGRKLARLVSRNSYLVRAVDGAERITFVMIAGLIVLAMVRTWSTLATRAITILLVLATVVFCAVGYVKPIVAPRTLFWLNVFPLLLVAIAIGSIKSRLGYLAVLATMVGLFVANLSWSHWTFLEEDGYSEGLMHVAADPNRVMVVESEAMGNIVQRACRVTYPDKARCPIRIFTIRTNKKADVWATGTIAEPILPWNRLREVIPLRTEIYTLGRWGIYDPASKIYKSYWIKPTAGPMRVRLDGPFSAEHFAHVTTNLSDHAQRK